MTLESKGNWETAGFQEKRVNKDMKASILLLHFNKCSKTCLNLWKQINNKSIRIITYKGVVFFR